MRKKCKINKLCPFQEKHTSYFEIAPSLYCSIYFYKNYFNINIFLLNEIIWAVMKILCKENSVADWGTYTSNAIIVGNTNALNEVQSESYN